MVIFQYNLYIFGIHLCTMLYPKPYYNELCYKEVVMYLCFGAYGKCPKIWYTKVSDKMAYINCVDLAQMAQSGAV